MLPLATCLLSVCVLANFSRTKLGWVAILISFVFLGWVGRLQATQFRNQLGKIQQFPNKQQGATTAWKDMCIWIRFHTPEDAIVISPPVEFTNFSWLSERATIAKYKLLPQNKDGLLSWYERLDDLSGEINPWETNPGEALKTFKVKKLLTKGYNHLTSDQVKDLGHKYQASYFVTRIEHQLDLPVAYQNSEFILYANATHRINH